MVIAISRRMSNFNERARWYREVQTACQCGTMNTHENVRGSCKLDLLVKCENLKVVQRDFNVAFCALCTNELLSNYIPGWQTLPFSNFNSWSSFWIYRRNPFLVMYVTLMGVRDWTRSWITIVSFDSKFNRSKRNFLKETKRLVFGGEHWDNWAISRDNGEIPAWTPKAVFDKQIVFAVEPFLRLEANDLRVLSSGTLDRFSRSLGPHGPFRLDTTWSQNVVNGPNGRESVRTTIVSSGSKSKTRNADHVCIKSSCAW